ncbi:hypothetical protein Kpol_461p17 [Vanderwaltozyma polyspora DSM 70294]|uniref:Ribosomal RNA-processing protein 14/surfeit locus protein 6 C-terminal domain-containing protein n=1 Tax=Vanderwaltozyma polyspora (strain ATCC 22028 / DSM 70294 / BCRC 21397 / CBS 2163 / NBRC 10782 / NRRL Y-8283 / UCD 57-17) TaxID=436907 RepID=A7TR53_VANPO|nr:uncharacterized protein Kpol_461p17 [Vanderwaltozyma polyspora DSM 70294]EDO15263.1 hypothetical protein Kpol_461p17 [Vanderwaltozyma polyspora DSM 70294]
MSNSLEERLRSNSNAFDGLLCLIPAKYYYDDATKDQWKAKKKSKEQQRSDKMSKLNPDDESTDDKLTALQVLEKKQKSAKPVVLPGEKFKKIKEQQEAKKTQQKQGNVNSNADDDEEEEEEEVNVIFDDDGNEVKDSDASISDSTESNEAETAEMETPVENVKKPEPTNSKKEKKAVGENDKLKKQKNLDNLRSILQSRIQQMREKRKAPGTRVDGAPSSREAILEQRKHKATLRKEKKEIENTNKSDSEDDDDEEDLDDINDDIDDDITSQSSKKRKMNDHLAKDIMFQNIEFDDGDRATSDLQRIRKAPKNSGPAKNDIKAHLKLLEAKKNKLESKDELEQIKLKEKEKWQKTMLLAEGVKLKNDEKLLRKALKRKETKKRKSAIEWKERQRAVSATISERQKRREENLQIRKDNKGKKRSKQQKMKRKYTGTVAAKLPKKQKRAGFEGQIKSGIKK